MKKILKFLNDYLEETICIILMSVMTIIIFIQVIMRYVMHNSLSWSEELARYCFVWLIYIGVAYGCKLMKHIKIDAALKLFPESMTWQPPLLLWQKCGATKTLSPRVK